MANLALVVSILASVFISLCRAKCGQLFENKVSDADKSTIVDIHNMARSLIAEGKIPRQPRAKNFKTMKWDDRLAKEAQRIANLCEFQHAKVQDNRFRVGQNLGWTGSTSNAKGTDWKGAIGRWFDEHKDFTYPHKSTGVTGHYTQMVWADTYLVGCGYSMYRKNFWYEKLYVCNYGPAGNYIGEAPYKV